MDAQILLWIQESIRCDWLTVFMRFVTRLGDAGFIWILLGLVLLTQKKYRLAGFTVLFALLTEWLLVDGVIKNIVQRSRPFYAVPGLEALIALPKSFSFPSGHSASSFAAALAMYLTLPRSYGIPALVLAVLVAFSRLYVGVHYPSDVLVGICIGILMAVLNYRFLYLRASQKIRKQNTKETHLGDML